MQWIIIAILFMFSISTRRLLRNILIPVFITVKPNSTFNGQLKEVVHNSTNIKKEVIRYNKAMVVAPFSATRTDIPYKDLISLKRKKNNRNIPDLYLRSGDNPSYAQSIL